jgi:type II secretory pathway pseudopilin PulG
MVTPRAWSIRRLTGGAALPARDDGFSIVETVVAITLMVFASAIAMQFLSTAARATAHAHTTEQAASIADGVIDSQAALGCTTATTPAMIVAAAASCGNVLGDRTVTITRDGHAYQVALQTSWVAVTGGTDQLRLRQSVSVTTSDALGTHAWPVVTVEEPLGGTLLSRSGPGRISVTAAPGAQVAMVVGTAKLVHTVPANGVAVFPYLPVQPTTSYFFQLVGGSTPKQVDLNAGQGGGIGAISLP